MEEKAVGTIEELVKIVNELDENNIVEKSDPLFYMKGIPFTLGELKLIDVYLSRINSSDDTRRTVVFTKEEYEQLMELKNVDGRTLDRNTDRVMEKVVKLKVGEYFDKFHLFERATYKENENGKKVVVLKCTETAKDFFFCLGKYHYTGYKLRNVLALSSKHSYLLFLYVAHNKFRKKWSVSLDYLRDTVFDLEGNDIYKQFKYFKRDVLDKAVNEVCEKTDCKVKYNVDKKGGRRVVDIIFEYIPKDPQLTFDELENSTPDVVVEATSSENEYSQERYEYFASACDYEFVEEEIITIVTCLGRLYDKGRIKRNDDESKDTAMFRYLAEKHNSMNVYARVAKESGKPIGKRYRYLIKMLENELKD